MIISLIVAMDEKGGIGKDNQLPWHIRSDLQRFKSLTMGHHLVMGRKTYETIRKPLPGRKMIVVTNNTTYHPNGCFIANTIKEAIQFADSNDETEVFIIGGGDIFKQSIDIANKMYITNVHAQVDADVFFPAIDFTSWELIWSEVIIRDKKDSFESDFKIFVRNK